MMSAPIKIILSSVIVGSVHSVFLTTYQGRITSLGITVSEVKGVAVLGLGDTSAKHSVVNIFDCETSQGSGSDLTWTKKDGIQRFPTSVALQNRLRMDFSKVRHDDAGVYICTNVVQDPPITLSINIVAESHAIAPVDPTPSAIYGQSAELSVYAAGIPPLASHEIQWHHPSGELIVPNSRITFHDSNKRLIIRNVSLSDNGSYRVEIYRNVAVAMSKVVAAHTRILLQVQEAVAANPSASPDTADTTVVANPSASPDTADTTVVANPSASPDTADTTVVANPSASPDTADTTVVANPSAPPDTADTDDTANTDNTHNTADSNTTGGAGFSEAATVQTGPAVIWPVIAVVLIIIATLIVITVSLVVIAVRRAKETSRKNISKRKEDFARKELEMRRSTVPGSSTSHTLEMVGTKIASKI